MTTELWMAIGIIVLIALLILWWPFARRSQISSQDEDARSVANKQSYFNSLEKLDAQLSQARIEQQEYDTLKAELGRKLLQDEATKEQRLEVKSHSVFLPITLSLFLVVTSVYMYMSIGSSQELAKSASHQSEAKTQQQKFLQALTMLEEKVAQSPDNSEVLFNLAHFYISAQQFDKAVAAFKKLIVMEGEHAEFIGPQAQALYYKNQQKITPEVEELIKRALALDADDVSTLVLLGMDNFVNGDYSKAIIMWQRVLNNDRPGTDVQTLTNAVASAKERLAMTGQAMPKTPAATTSSAGVDLNVSISDSLQGQFEPQQTIFIYAIALEGPRMPLAAVKLTASQLPLSIRLDDSRAMTPNAKISQHQQVRLFAVISKSGSPGIKPGDLHGMIEKAQLNAKQPYTLIIDKVAE